MYFSESILFFYRCSEKRGSEKKEREKEILYTFKAKFDCMCFLIQEPNLEAKIGKSDSSVCLGFFFFFEQ